MKKLFLVRYENVVEAVVQAEDFAEARKIAKDLDIDFRTPDRVSVDSEITSAGGLTRGLLEAPPYTADGVGEQTTAELLAEKAKLDAAEAAQRKLFA